MGTRVREGAESAEMIPSAASASSCLRNLSSLGPRGPGSLRHPPYATMPRVPLRLVNHPLVHDALMELRDARTGPPAFRRAANRISVLLAAEALKDVPATEATVITPLGPAQG